MQKCVVFKKCIRIKLVKCTFSKKMLEGSNIPI
jgi:hypothetical protein